MRTRSALDRYQRLRRLDDNEKAILQEITSNSEYCINYQHLVGTNNLSRKQIEPIIARLKDMQFIEFHRGLMTEDGEVAGSGWCRTELGNRYLERHEL